MKFRYKEPNGKKSKLIEEIVKTSEEISPSVDFNFVSAVALFGMNLRESEFTNEKGIPMVLELAEKGRGKDDEGYKAEFIRLVKSYNSINKSSEE